MKLWEAMMLMNEGNKVRLKHWEKHDYIYLNDNDEVCWSNGNLVGNIPNVGEWELYDNRRDAELAWRIIFRNVKGAESFIDEYISDSYECNKCECDDCIYSTACNIFDDLCNELERLNQFIKLDKKHEFED